MDDTVRPFDEYRESECSGRSLATLLVVWVSAAMVASVFLRWKYMWIALAVLTLLFLLACGYAAFSSRRMTNGQVHSRIMEQRRTLQSVSGGVENCPETGEPPAYQAYWITDLPPPYAVVIAAEPTTLLSLEAGNSSNRVTDPPPYSIAVGSHVDEPDSTVGNKDTEEQGRNGVLASSTQYLSNFLSHTFGRGSRRQGRIGVRSDGQENPSTSVD